MSRSRSRSTLSALLDEGRLLKLPEVAERLGVSSSTATRDLNSLGPARVLPIGERRGRRYLGLRDLGRPGPRLPIFRILPDGTSTTFGSLVAAGVSGYYVETSDGPGLGRVHRDPPEFLRALAPEGYLNPQHAASSDDLIRYLHDEVHDGPGDLILGTPAFQKYLQSVRTPLPRVSNTARKTTYPRLALGTVHHADGTLLGGTHPKFLCTTAKRGAVIVKFTPPLDQAVGRRTGDLLVAEHLAQTALRSAGVPAAETEIVQTQSQLFLEVERFDRTETGRRGAISLAALAYDSDLDATGTWPQICARLVEQKVVDESTLTQVRFLWAFGRLIARDDMNPDRLTFSSQGLKIEQLAPAHSMAPRLYAPRRGHVTHPNFETPMPEAQDGPIWEAATQLATYVWEQISRSPLVSLEFQKIARANIEVVRQASRLAGRLPKPNTSAAKRIKRSLAARKGHAKKRLGPFAPRG